MKACNRRVYNTPESLMFRYVYKQTSMDVEERIERTMVYNSVSDIRYMVFDALQEYIWR